MRFRADIAIGRNAPQVTTIDAASLEEARQQVVSRGHTLLSLRPLGPSWLARREVGSARTNSFDVTVFAEQLRDLLNAGLSVIEALSTLQKGAKADTATLLASLVSRLRGGGRLSEAFAAQTQFPQLLVALVRASELTSGLPQALNRFLEHEQRVRELRHRVTSVAIYPLLLTGVGTGVLLFLLLYVMPRFARVFEGMSGELPWSARAMVWWAGWLSGHGPWVFVALAGLASVVVLLVTSQALRNRLLSDLLNWAPLRDRLRTYFLARWYRATGMLVEGGIPLPEALGLSQSLLPLALQASGAAVERAVRDGYGPAAAHERAGMATPVAEQLMRAGERTGDLGAVLTRVAQFHEAELTRSLERGMRALEPVVMVGVGVGIGAVVVLMYLPIFELAATIQ